MTSAPERPELCWSCEDQGRFKCLDTKFEQAAGRCLECLNAVRPMTPLQFAAHMRSTLGGS